DPPAHRPRPGRNRADRRSRRQRGAPPGADRAAGAAAKASPSHQAFGIHRVEVYGEHGAAVTECVTRSVERLAFGGGVLSTACPPAIVAEMICRGELTQRGVLPSERAVPFAPLFERLERY